MATGTGDGTNGGKVESMNAGVRSFTAVALILTTCIAFIYGTVTGKPSVSTDAFMGLVGVVVTWLFKSRDEQQRQEAQTTTTKTIDTDPSGAKREVTLTAPPGVSVSPPVVVSPTPPPKVGG